jgi:hypothetical protein
LVESFAAGVLFGLFLNVKPNGGLTEKDLISWVESRTAAVTRLNLNGLTVSKNPRPVGAAVVVKAELASLFVEPDMCMFTRNRLVSVGSTFLENQVVPPNDAVVIVKHLSQTTQIDS